MLTQRNQKLPPAVDQWLSKNRIIIELILTLLACLGLLLHQLKIKGGPEFMMIAMSTLAAFYFLMAFTTLAAEGVVITIVYKILSIASAVVINGVLFGLLKLTGSEQMISIGLISFLVGGVVLLFFVIRQSDNKYVPMLIRILFLSLLVFCLKYLIVT